MGPIKQMEIAGFRAILSPLQLQFVKENSTRSMIIHGRNGTGKSSITDAWEWFHTGRIEHLARQGAGPSAYPHWHAKAGETFIEVLFADDELGTIRSTFDQSRVTIPISDGDIAKLRALAPHRCHVRFGDLTRFVYLRKTEKYDELAGLMGFTAQVELQKVLRRTLRQLNEKLETRQQNVEEIESALSELLDVTDVDESTILNSLNKLLRRHGVEAGGSVGGLQEPAAALTTQVETDARSQELAEITILKSAIEGVRLPTDLQTELSSYAEVAQTFKKDETATVGLLLLGLYEQGLHVLARRKETGEEIECCPLCGQRFEGDLLEHISTELGGLQGLKASRDELETERKRIQTLLPPLESQSETLQERCKGIEPVAEQWPVDAMMDQTGTVDECVKLLKILLATPAENLDEKRLHSMRSGTESLGRGATELKETRDNLLGQLEQRITELEKDTSRAQLVSDHREVLSALEMWAQLETAYKRLTQLSDTHKSFHAVVEDYVQSSIGDVQKRFDIISSDVERYFGILEEHTEGLGRPALKLLTDQDRAVVLEVEFHGEPIYPAYRYLSESQLNSFGLAVFLASAKYFNRDFRFLILDDVINSFDGYKRPQVIKLLKQEFSDHQVLLLTHDSVWRDRLFEACPSWVKRRFTRLELGVGPIDVEAAAPLTTIERLLDNDEPVSAGQAMGLLLERQLQQVGESFEIFVKFNQRREYTLHPLLDRLRVRVREKLGKDHSLYHAIGALQEEAGFRNLCAHWKNPDIQLTTEEMRAVVRRWQAVDALVRCQSESCLEFLQYNGKDFVCRCGAAKLGRTGT